MAVDKVRIPIISVDDDAPAVDYPKYAYPGDAGMDIRSNEDVIIAPFQRYAVHTGIAFALPEGYAAFVFPRSGLALKSGISMANAVGVIDSNYRGELKVSLINLDPKESFSISRGDRIAQLVVMRVSEVSWQPAAQLDSTQRGERGFGSSGIRSNSD